MLRPIVGAQQMEHDGDSAAGDAGCFWQAKEFLNTDREHGGSFEFVVNSNLAAAGDANFLGGFSVKQLLLLVSQAGAQCCRPGGAVQFGERSAAGTQPRQ